MCERAVFGHEPPAMLAIGRRFREAAATAREEAAREAKAANRSMWQVDLSGFEHSLHWFERAAEHCETEAEDREAIFERARIMLTDLRREETTEEALRLLEWSAEVGYADAQSMLALLLLDPQSPVPGPRDLNKARDWAERAAASEHPEALNVLAAIYGNGMGVERDPERALRYARRASDAGYPLAHANLADMLVGLPADKRSEDEIRALIARAKAGGADHVHWAEYRLLVQRGEGSTAIAEAALHAAAKARVVPAALLLAERTLNTAPSLWNLAPLLGRVLGVLADSDDEEERAEANRMLRPLRDEAERRWRVSPPGKSADDYFGYAVQAGAALDLQIGQDAEEKAFEVMSALVRVQGMPGEPATREDVEMVLAALPSLPVRWTPAGPVFENARHADVEIRGGAVPAAPRVLPARRPSRNAPCPCGSTRKYKGCCGKAES